MALSPGSKEDAADEDECGGVAMTLIIYLHVRTVATAINST